MTFNLWFSGFLGPQACATMQTFVSRALNLFWELSGEGCYSLATVRRLKEKANAHLPFGGQHTLEFFPKWEPASWAGYCDSQRRGRVPTAKLKKVREWASKLHSSVVPASRFLPRVPSLTSLHDGFWPARISQCSLPFLCCCRSEGFMTAAERKVGGGGSGDDGGGGVPYQELTTYIHFNLELSSLQNYLKYVSVT